MKKTAIILVFVFMLIVNVSSAEGLFPFQAEVDADDINIRADSTVSSQVICHLKHGESLEVVAELYGWYKIRLPKSAPAFIKKSLVVGLDDKGARVTGNRVNIRLGPSESSPIIGIVNQDELITLIKEEGQWYRIEPINNSFGWVHKKFVKRVAPVIKAEIIEENKVESQATQEANNITVEGLLKPKTIKSMATHKLITQEKKIFLLKGNPDTFGALNYFKVRVIGRLAAQEQKSYTLVEVLKIERID
jgi:SH3-like domain-containing protein